jgi:ApbE superfamily uncharacterized protein (UPF0280 family)
LELESVSVGEADASTASFVSRDETSFADKAAGAMVLMAHPCHSDSEPSFGQRY